ncbi:autoinducer synthase [Hyphomicrobium methylovorum]|uniref:N-acyl amino acid synthase FeeM domain-containing protein n=1 Tax=Hyphomicrobium methylovorum TaxID=84 RepID=UPI0015E777C4|nr:acyl-homoserine-lactone synthase [Hyphomicrobium methylovorum]MBA2126221.1 autoinducer synthase [Hyphomicrobium methylovorum]
MSQPLAFRPRQDTLPTEEGSWHGDAKNFDLRALSSSSDIREALRLRGRAYSGIGYNIDCVDGEYRDEFDDMPTTVLLGAYDQNRLVGCVRLCFSHPRQSLSTLPCASHYPALNDVKAQQPNGLVEVSRLSIEPGLNNVSYRTTLYAFLVRASLTAALAAGVSMLLIATRPDWVRFYTYMLGFKQIGDAALYPPGDFKITLLGGSLEQAQMRQKLQNRFFKISNEEIASMERAIAPAMARTAAPELRVVS